MSYIVLGIVTRLQAAQKGIGLSTDERGFPLLRNVQNSSVAHPAFYSIDRGFLISEIKRPEVRNTWSDISARPITFTTWT